MRKSSLSNILFSICRSHHALGPHCHEQLISDMDISYYSLQYDETTNHKNVKVLQVLIKFWSKSKNKVVDRHLETFFIGKATAKILSEKIKAAVNNANLSLAHVVMIASDGPNVNKAVFKILSNEINLIRSKPLLDVETCNIHTVHNAFRKALKKLGMDLSDFIIMVHSFMYDFPKRRQDFEIIQENLKLPNHQLKKHVESRWLTLEEGCVVTIEQLPAIKEYLLNFIPKEVPILLKIKKYKAIVQILQVPTFEAELNFVANSAKLFLTFTKFFQKNEPLIHVLFTELYRLVTTIINLICLKSCEPSKLFCIENLLPLEKITLSNEVNEKLKLKTIKPRDALEFRQRVQQHYIVACEHLFKKTVLNSELPQYRVKYFRFLLPSEIKNHKERNIKDVTEIANELPASIPIDEIIDELKLLHCEVDSTKTKSEADNDVIQFWTRVFQSKICGSNERKYPNLTLLAKISFLIYHGSADIERSISESGNMLTGNQASMSVELLNAKLNVRSMLKQYNNQPELVPITPDLMQKVRASYSIYKAFLEKKREEEKVAKKKSEEEKQKKEEIKDSKNLLLVLEDKLKSYKRDLLGKRKVYEETVQLGNKKLKRALDKNDLTNARVAQTIISGAENLKTEESALEKKH